MGKEGAAKDLVEKPSAGDSIPKKAKK